MSSLVDATDPWVNECRCSDRSTWDASLKRSLRESVPATALARGIRDRVRTTYSVTGLESDASAPRPTSVSEVGDELGDVSGNEILRHRVMADDRVRRLLWIELKSLRHADADSLSS